MPDLREGPDADTYEIAVLVDMLLAVSVSLVSIYGIYFDWTHHHATLRTPTGFGIALALLSSIGLIIGFASNRSPRKRVAALTLVCSLVIPAWVVLTVGIERWNAVLTMLVGPGILLAVLSCVKLKQMHFASHFPGNGV